jgi:hypothetical protein
MTREQIEKRLADFKEGKAKAEAMVVQLQANIHATDGAIQECEFWLAQLNTEMKQEKEKK